MHEPPMRRAAERRIYSASGSHREQLDRRKQPLTSIEGQLQRAKRFLELSEPYIKERLKKIREHYAKFGRKLTPEEENYWRQITHESLKKVMERTYVRARDIAETDPKTQLPLEVVFQRRVEDYLKDQEHGTFFFIDLNNLKKINDDEHFGGHDIGDIYLTTFANVMREIAHEYPGITIARFGKGSDEFGMFCSKDISLETANAIAEDLKTRFKDTWATERLPFHGDLSLGIAQTDELPQNMPPNQKYAILRKKSDGRMFEEKRRSKKGRR